MNEEQNLNEDVRSALVDAEAMKREMDGLKGEIGSFDALVEVEPHAMELLSDFYERVSTLISRLERGLGSFQAKKSDQFRSSAAYSMMIINNEIGAQLDWLKSYLEKLKRIISKAANKAAFVFSLKKNISDAARRLRNYLLPIFKKLSAKLWQIISHLMTPKEWKISGNIGTGVLGLANVGIEITFGHSFSSDPSDDN